MTEYYFSHTRILRSRLPPTGATSAKLHHAYFREGSANSRRATRFPYGSFDMQQGTASPLRRTLTASEQHFVLSNLLKEHTRPQAEREHRVGDSSTAFEERFCPYKVHQKKSLRTAHDFAEPVSLHGPSKCVSLLISLLHLSNCSQK